MKRLTSPLFLASCLIALGGCGGHRGGSSSSSTENAFQGDYVGSYQAPFLDDTGTYVLSVTPSGSVSGTGTSDNGGEGVLSGNFNSAGFFSGRIVFGNDTSGTLSGTLTQADDGTLSGTLTEVYGTLTGPVTVELSPTQD